MMHLDMSMEQHFFVDGIVDLLLCSRSDCWSTSQYLSVFKIRSLQILKAHEMDSMIGLLFLAKFNMRYRQTDGKYLCFMTLT